VTPNIINSDLRRHSAAYIEDQKALDHIGKLHEELHLLPLQSTPTMFPPSEGYNLDIEAISGICGSISIACWVVVFSPQIVENFRRSSAEGLSVEFIVIWLAGDVFNILGAVLQGVLPTMIVLAIYCKREQ
jgi:hypothetical protein